MTRTIQSAILLTGSRVSAEKVSAADCVIAAIRDSGDCTKFFPMETRDAWVSELLLSTEELQQKKCSKAC